MNTLINDDKDTIEQYRYFEKMVDECNEVSLSNDENEKSKWVIRMMMASCYLTKELPFKDVYLHGLIRDENNEKNE